MTESKSQHGVFSTDEWLFFRNCLRPIRPIFARLARAHGLVPYAGTMWPFLGLRASHLIWCRQLELMLQPQFIHDQRVVFDLRFAQSVRTSTQLNQEFCCGRYDVGDFAQQQWMRAQLETKLDLLGMATALRLPARGEPVPNRETG